MRASSQLQESLITFQRLTLRFKTLNSSLKGSKFYLTRMTNSVPRRSTGMRHDPDAHYGNVTDLSFAITRSMFSSWFHFRLEMCQKIRTRYSKRETFPLRFNAIFAVEIVKYHKHYRNLWKKIFFVNLEYNFFQVGKRVQHIKNCTTNLSSCIYVPIFILIHIGLSVSVF